MRLKPKLLLAENWSITFRITFWLFFVAQKLWARLIPIFSTYLWSIIRSSNRNSELWQALRWLTFFVFRSIKTHFNELKSKFRPTSVGVIIREKSTTAITLNESILSCFESSISFSSVYSIASFWSKFSPVRKIPPVASYVYFTFWLVLRIVIGSALFAPSLSKSILLWPSSVLFSELTAVLIEFLRTWRISTQFLFFICD